MVSCRLKERNNPLFVIASKVLAFDSQLGIYFMVDYR